MAGALGDAAWMTGMERNSDLILISCYAPLFVNVSDLSKGGSMQWRSDLIGYDALNSYGSPSYYAQQMFSTHHGDTILATGSENIPEVTWQPPTHKRNGVEQPRPAARQIQKLFFNATRDSRSGTIYLKVVNGLETPQLVKVEISGVKEDRRQGRRRRDAVRQPGRHEFDQGSKENYSHSERTGHRSGHGFHPNFSALLHYHP